MFRDNIVQKMNRNSVLKTGDDKGVPLSQLLAETLMCQAHLCPLPMSVAPVHWDYDSSLRLYPLPQLLVLADHHEHYSHEIASADYEGTAVINPGSFSVDFSFFVYRPGSRELELSQL